MLEIILKRMLKKIPKQTAFFALAALTVLTGTLFVPHRAESVADMIRLEVTGILVEIDESADPETITLKVNDTEAKGWVQHTCEYRNERDQVLPRDEFLRRYLNKTVTAELYEATGEVYLCYAGNSRSR